VHRELGAWPWTADLGIVRSRLREVLRFTVYVDASSLVSTVVKQADVLILGALAGSVAAGQYRLAKQISAGAASLAGSLQAWLYPRLATASGARDEDQFRQLLRRATLLLGVPGAALTLVALPILPAFVRMTAGAEFTGAIVPAQLLTAGAALSTLFLVFRPAYLAAGHVRTFLTIVTMTSVLCLVGFVVVSDPWGADGVAVVRLLVVSIVGNVVGAYFLLRWAQRRTLVAGGAAAPSAEDQGIRETET
jgi:PST family polysaccharide transporter